MSRVLPHTLVSLLLIILQTTLVPFLSVVHIVPDLLVIWIVYLAIREGQIAGTLAGFLLGLGPDLVAGNDAMLGLSSLSLSACGFAAGYFHDAERTPTTLGGGRFVSAIAVAGLLHYALYFLIFLQGTSFSRGEALLFYAFPSTLYTVVVGLVPMFVFRRRYVS